MKGFLRNNMRWPNRAPKLNRAHPLFSQEHMTFAGVATHTGGALDLVTNTYATNTGTKGGVDENGPYVYASDGASTSELTWSGFGSAANFITLGLIFKHISSSTRNYPFTVQSNTGFFVNGNTLEYVVANGNTQSVTLTPGHTYYAIMCNGPATSGYTHVNWTYDMTAGQLLSVGTGTVGGNVSAKPITWLVPSSGIFLDRVYAGFASGSANTPPSVVDPPTFYSQGIMLGTLADPWSMWYAS